MVVLFVYVVQYRINVNYRHCKQSQSGISTNSLHDLKTLYLHVSTSVSLSRYYSIRSVAQLHISGSTVRIIKEVRHLYHMKLFPKTHTKV
jgi:hypothetical protein